MFNCYYNIATHTAYQPKKKNNKRAQCVCITTLPLWDSCAGSYCIN